MRLDWVLPFSMSTPAWPGNDHDRSAVRSVAWAGGRAARVWAWRARSRPLVETFAPRRRGGGRRRRRPAGADAGTGDDGEEAAGEAPSAEGDAAKRADDAPPGEPVADFDALLE